MGVYLRGTAVTIVERFWTVDPVTLVAALTDPTGIVFTVQAPDGTETEYEFGVDPEVTHASTGIYLCELSPPLPAGMWTYRCDGTGTVEASAEGTFTVLESGVLDPTDPGVATGGPCQEWINGGDVAMFDSTLGVGSNTFELDDVAQMASDILFAASGRLYPGICERKVRPCRDTCSCWGSVASGLTLWSWSTLGWGIGAWGWTNECGDKCGCGSESYIKLSGYPVREILEVKIDGVALSDTGEYRLDRRRNLIRLADPGPPVIDRQWPGCQDLSLDDSQPGTFSVRYSWGQQPPMIGKTAAAQLAAELYRSFNGGPCKLPTRVTKIVRAGITMEKIVPLAESIRKGATGLNAIDFFISMSNPKGMQRRPAVFTPDKQKFARKVGQ